MSPEDVAQSVFSRHFLQDEVSRVQGIRMAVRATLVAKPIVRKKIRVRDRDPQVYLDERLRGFGTIVSLIHDPKMIIIF